MFLLYLLFLLNLWKASTIIMTLHSSIFQHIAPQNKDISYITPMALSSLRRKLIMYHWMISSYSNSPSNYHKNTLIFCRNSLVLIYARHPQVQALPLENKSVVFCWRWGEAVTWPCRVQEGLHFSSKILWHHDLCYLWHLFHVLHISFPQCNAFHIILIATHIETYIFTLQCSRYICIK